MNAAEARRVTSENLEKLADEQMKGAIGEIESRIKNAVKTGHSNIVCGIDIHSALVKTKFIDQVVDHFENKGYAIEYTYMIFGPAANIHVSWK